MTVSDVMFVRSGYANDAIVNIPTDKITKRSTYEQLYEKLKFGCFIFSYLGTSYNQ
jgi:hypothetical protein